MVRTRIAPSPTGEYHIGHLRTCLYDYAWAKKNQGQFVIRIEDTDQKRYVPGAVERILQVIRDYGLSWDEGPDVGGKHGPYIQSQRQDIYKKHIEILLNKKNHQGNPCAYHCFCSQECLDKMRDQQKKQGQVPRYDRRCLALTSQEVEAKLKKGEPYVIRLRIPDNEVIEFSDLVRGQVKIDSRDLDDQVLIKSDGIPTYHFAVVVDDHLMEITHVFRGEEWIPSTPKQALLYRYFDWPMPVFAHLTVLLDPSGKGKMGKRRGSVSARSFLDDGYLPEALLNFLMFLGWNPGDNREIFSLEEFVQAFNLENLHKKAPVFDRNKLDYLNGYYIRQKTDQELAELLKPFLPELDEKSILFMVPLIKERIKTLSEAKELLEFIWQEPDYSKDLLLGKGLDQNLAREMLSGALEIIQRLGIDDTDKLQKEILALIESRGWKTGQFFMVFRTAICGKPITPPILESLPLLGKKKVLDRLEIALKKLI
ncbi:MAG: glutamate--tRNA ligase [Patescibacteria group bacterium]